MLGRAVLKVNNESCKFASDPRNHINLHVDFIFFFPTTNEITENLGRRKKGVKGADTEVGVWRGGMGCRGLEGEGESLV